ncbi:MAG TPA: hypothetical protein VMF89_29435, partial [Polyangiales bacterium]|nr:hypothetical protein [Polyangiales bacterium]
MTKSNYIKTVWLVSLVLCAGCSTYRPPPRTPAELVGQYRSTPDALVAYLSRSDADSSVCDVKADGPHIPVLTAAIADALVSALVYGTIAPDAWRQCTEHLMKSVPPTSFAVLLDEAGAAYRLLLSNAAFERDLDLQMRLAELHRLYLERPADLDATPEPTARL